MSNFVAILNRLNGECRIFSKIERKRRGMRMEVRGIRVRFKEIDIEDWMKAREIRRMMKKIGRKADFLLDWVWTKLVMVQLDRWANRLDIVVK